MIMISAKSLEVQQFHFDVQVDYSDWFQNNTTHITIPTFSSFKENGVNKVEDYNCYARLTEELLQELYNEAHKIGTFGIPAIVQFSMDKKILMKVIRDEGITTHFEIEVTRKNLIKALDYNYSDIQKACQGAATFIYNLNNPQTQYQLPPVVKTSSVVVGKAFQRSIIFRGTGSIKPMLTKEFGTEIEKYFESKELISLTKLFKEVYMNDDHISVAVDRKNRRNQTFTFDEAALFLMLVYPTMVYIPRYNEHGLAQCKFFEAEASDNKDVQHGFFESSNINYRYVVTYFEPREVNISEPKFLPCIQFMESVLTSPNGDLKNLNYDESNLFANCNIPSTKTLNRIEEFLRRVYTI
jgi:hypothetical protein